MSKKSAKTEQEINEAEKNAKDNAEEANENKEATDKTDEKANEADNLRKEIDELKDKNLRLMAEFENYKRRTRQEKESTYEFALSDAVKNFIPVLDTLEIALKNNSEDMQAYIQGIELIVKNFKDTLSKMGVNPIEALGNPFDPELHNAVMSTDEGDEESGTIVEEFQKGYKLKERVIRHSMVKVKN